MILYCIIIYFLVFALAIDLRGRKASGNNTIMCITPFQKYFSISALIILWALTAFRAVTIGNDTVVYVRYFQSIDSYGVNSNYAIEMGFQWLIALIGRFTDDPHVFLIILSSLLYGVLAYIIFKYSDNYLISIALSFFLCYGSFCNIMRQSLAMVICFIAYLCLKKGKTIWFVILVLFASTFHTSALIVLLLLLYKYIPKKGYFIAFACGLAIILSNTSYLVNISHLLGDEYTNYFMGKYADSGHLGVFLSLIKAVLMHLVIRISDEDMTDTSKKEYDIIYTSSFYMLFFLCCGFTVNLISRISDYFMMFSIIDIPYMLKIKNKKSNVYFIVLMGYMIIHFLAVQVFRPEWNHLYPYEFWK